MHAKFRSVYHHFASRISREMLYIVIRIRLFASGIIHDPIQFVFANIFFRTRQITMSHIKSFVVIIALVGIAFFSGSASAQSTSQPATLQTPSSMPIPATVTMPHPAMNLTGTSAMAPMPSASPATPMAPVMAAPQAVAVGSTPVATPATASSQAAPHCTSANGTACHHACSKEASVAPSTETPVAPK